MDEYDESEAAAEGKALQEKQKLAKLKENDDYKTVLSTRNGRRFVWRLLEAAGPYRATFHHDPGVMAFQEGVRSMGIQLLSKLEADHFEAYLQMQREHNEDLNNG